jgi:hypothetical protein
LAGYAGVSRSNSGLNAVWFSICIFVSSSRANEWIPQGGDRVEPDRGPYDGAVIPFLHLLKDDELILLVNFHTGYYQRWCETGENERVAVVYHGQILSALLDECARRGKSAEELGREYNRRIDLQTAWMQKAATA